jgi:hypothetical protein
MTVGMTHGIRMAARVTPRPKKALFMISAKTMPMMNSKNTDPTVNTNVASTESQNRGSVAAST